MSDPALPDLPEIVDRLERKLDTFENTRAARSGSRFVGQGAQADVVEHVAAGGDLPAGRFPTGWKTVRSPGERQTRLALALKALAEGTPSAGGYLVPVEVSAEIVMAIRARSGVLRQVLAKTPRGAAGAMVPYQIVAFAGAATAGVGFTTALAWPILPQVAQALFLGVDHGAPDLGGGRDIPAREHHCLPWR